MRLYRTAPEPDRRVARARHDLVVKLRGRRGWRTLLEQFNRGELWPEIRAGLLAKKKRQTVSPRTLRHWRRLYDVAGLDALVPLKSPGCPRTGAAQELEPRILWYLERYKTIRNTKLYQFLEYDREQGLLSGKLSLRQVGRLANKLRATHERRLTAIHDKKKFRNKFMAAPGNASACAHGPHDVWEIDTTPADILCLDGGRRKIIGVVDVFSRAAHFRLVEEERAIEVLATLGEAIRKWRGVPKAIRMDNGRCYRRSRQVQQACERLRTQVWQLPPGTPEKKPHIERMFKTISDDLLLYLPGSTGNSLLTRPETIELKLTPEDLARHIADWTDGTYMERPHEGIGEKRPRGRLFGPDYRPQLVEEKTLKELLAPLEDRTVQKKGILFDERWYWDSQSKLASIIGEKVRVAADLDDTSRLTVYGQADPPHYICIARCVEAQGVPLQVAKEARKESLKALRGSKKAVQAREEADAKYLEILAGAKRKKPGIVTPPAEVLEFAEAAKAAKAKARLDEEEAAEAQAVNAAPKQPKRYLSPHLLEKLRKEVV